MVGLLWESAALEKQHQSLVVGCASRLEYRLNSRPDIEPDLSPDFRRRTPEGPRTFYAEGRPGGVVGKKCKLSAPSHPHCIPGRKQDVDHSAKALGPAFDGADRGLRPFMSANECR